MITDYRDIPLENCPERWAAIKHNYKIHGLRNSDLHGGCLRIAAFFIERKHMTPIEWEIWKEARTQGIDFFPQYPAGKYFLDFANPYLGIAIECDGFAYHSSDKDMLRDLDRDAALRADGWNVYRIWGSDCIRNVDSPFDFHDEGDEITPEKIRKLRMWISGTPDGIMSAIADRISNGSSFSFLREEFGADVVNGAMSQIRLRRATGDAPTKRLLALQPTEEMMAEYVSLKTLARSITEKVRNRNREQETAQ